MSSKAAILHKIKQNQPTELSELPSVGLFVLLGLENKNLVDEYKSMVATIGGTVVEVANISEVKDYIKLNFNLEKRIITTIPELSEIASLDWTNDDPHSLKDVELNIVKAHFAVAENSALWVTDDVMGQRVSTFIPQYLAIVVSKTNIVPTMHQAYNRIGNQDYGFGTFIAGPSKTADIEQSLVLGAHGARGIIVFVMD